MSLPLSLSPSPSPSLSLSLKPTLTLPLTRGMLWPADFPADWASDDYVGYVPRIPMFEGQRALEATQVKSAFPHPAELWEWITGKTWMATLAPQAP